MSDKFIQAKVTESEFLLIKIAALTVGKSIMDFAKEAMLEKCKQLQEKTDEA
jgi:uncharacterized protein (DUF1778 family)